MKGKGPASFRCGSSIRRQDLLSPGNLFGGCGKDLVRNWNLRRMNAPFAVVPERTRDEAGAPESVQIAKVRIRSVNGQDTCCARANQNPLQGVVPAVSR